MPSSVLSIMNYLGSSGVGKTTYGKSLEKWLGFSLDDLQTLVQLRTTVEIRDRDVVSKTTIGHSRYFAIPAVYRYPILFSGRELIFVDNKQLDKTQSENSHIR